MNTIIIALPAFTPYPDGVELPLFVLTLKDTASQKLYLTSITDAVEINLN